MKCGNCGVVILADSHQVWVCEHCGTENVPEAVTQPAPPVEPVVPQPTPVNPTQVTPTTG